MKSCLLGLLLLVGCGDGDNPLSRDVVTSLPDGDATGSAFSGSYRIEMLTESCAGQCPTFGLIVPCAAGTKVSSTAVVTQKDGHLEVGLTLLFYVRKLKGGVNSNGSFSVGGYEALIEDTGSVDITARADGTLTAAGQLTATSQARGTGSVDGKNIACTGTYRITGNRK